MLYADFLPQKVPAFEVNFHILHHQSLPHSALVEERFLSKAWPPYQSPTVTRLIKLLKTALSRAKYLKAKSWTAGPPFFTGT